MKSSLEKEAALNAEMLRVMLHYDPATGIFVWLAKAKWLPDSQRWNTRYAGKQAGWAHKPSRCNGEYRYVSLLGCSYLAHRLAWLYMTGSWPSDQVDHEDLDGLNNQWLNLRLATSTQNQANRLVQKNNKTKVKGVSLQKNGKYRARIQVAGRSISLGTHATLRGASALYNSAARKHFKAFARVNS